MSIRIRFRRASLELRAMRLACTRGWQAFLLKKVVELRGTNKLFSMVLWHFDLLAGVAAALRFFAL